MKKSDIICLQEIDVCSKYCPVDICQIIAHKLGFYYKYLKTINRKKGGFYGIGIFSKFKILSYKEHYYHKYDEKRGLQEIEVFVPKLKRNIKIFNTHLDYKYSRNYQVKQCLDIISKYHDYDCILCGDLNLNPTENIYNSLSDNFKNIIYNNTYSSKRPRQILDYILLSKFSNLKYKYKVDDVKLSDHRPLICKIKK